ncbi:TPA: DDE-type integrase/transposase/recombinase [Stenotrophomonas maltophilia]|nr:hypothetical protein [Stenotrophomonas maltophilia]PSD20785.1 hypothetical protein C7E15_03570 [Stenotrophomonas maltophilia]PZT10973.1 hypothetical protein A7X91_07880 [Stenotrophomonas maltophilia]HDS1596772.1 DDE-type integrase/transposase/recombinase [Stenotrophomonas maltophilia]
MDFVSDALFDGRRFRMLTVVDYFTRECLAIVVDQSLRGEHVAEAMTRLAAQRGSPGAVNVDNGSEQDKFTVESELLKQGLTAVGVLNHASPPPVI